MERVFSSEEKRWNLEILFFSDWSLVLTFSGRQEEGKKGKGQTGDVCPFARERGSEEEEEALCFDPLSLGQSSLFPSDSPSKIASFLH